MRANSEGFGKTADLQYCWEHSLVDLSITVKPVLRSHSKIEETKILMVNGSLMKVESIAKCSAWSILQYF